MVHPVDVHVGRKVKELRTLRNLTQQNVANSLNISFQQLQKYETGGNRISASRLYELARLLNVQTPYFFEGLAGEKTDANSTIDVEGFKIAALIAKIKNVKLKTHIRTLIAELATDSQL